MKFVSCKRNPHKDWGVNDPINLEHVASYSAGTVHPHLRSTKEIAPAIIFTLGGRPSTITWSFTDERNRDWEMGRLQELTYEPDETDIVAALMADRAA